jgi:hypothetical protein
MYCDEPVAAEAAGFGVIHTSDHVGESFIHADRRATHRRGIGQSDVSVDDARMKCAG